MNIGVAQMAGAVQSYLNLRRDSARSPRGRVICQKYRDRYKYDDGRGNPYM